MRSIIYTEGCLKGENLCILFGHKYVPVKSAAGTSEKMQCKICNHEFSSEKVSKARTCEGSKLPD